MERAGHLAQQVPRARPTKITLPRGRLAGRRGDAVEILLVRRMQAKTVGHAHGFLVELLQRGIGYAFDLRRLMEQLAVEQFPAEGCRQLSGNLAAPAPYSRVTVMTFIRAAPVAKSGTNNYHTPCRTFGSLFPRRMSNPSPLNSTTLRHDINAVSAYPRDRRGDLTRPVPPAKLKVLRWPAFRFFPTHRLSGTA